MVCCSPTTRFLSSAALGFALTWATSAQAANPLLLSGAVKNPYGGTAEIVVADTYCNNGDTTLCYNPTIHHTPWGGDWATDVWKDNFDVGVGDASCGKSVYLGVSIHKIPGGTRPDYLEGKLLESRLACSSQVYLDGGYLQKWEITAYAGGVAYPLGWVLYAHLDKNTLVYQSIGTKVNAANVYLGKTFQGGNLNSCWRSCHIHLELKNYDRKACWNIYPPTGGIGGAYKFGLLGGQAFNKQRCSYVEP